MIAAMQNVLQVTSGNRRTLYHN